MLKAVLIEIQTIIPTKRCLMTNKSLRLLGWFNWYDSQPHFFVAGCAVLGGARRGLQYKFQ